MEGTKNKEIAKERKI